MTRNMLALASALTVATLVASGLIVGSWLPADVQLPIHWGIGGEPDGFAGKWTALLLPALITAGVSILFWFLPSLEPRREGLARSQGLYLWGWAAVLLLGGAMEVAVVSVALGWGIPVNHLIVGILGLVLVMIGNQLGKSRSMYMIGLRTPWTLASEEVWIRTHRLAGKLMVLAGAAMVAAALLPLPSGLLATVAAAAIALAAGVPILYSFLLWRREKGTAQASE